MGVGYGTAEVLCLLYTHVPADSICVVVLSLSNAYVMHLSTNIAGHLSMESMIAVLLAMCSVS